MNLKPGALLQGGKYKIERVLGQGGFGITYLAEHVMLENHVTVKEFYMKDFCNRDTSTSQVSIGSDGSRETVDKFKRKFLKEARNIFKLQHDNIIKVLDVFEENGTAYYVMEYIAGGSLGDKINKSGAMSESEAMQYFLQIANALQFIHSQSIAHLDIKPANILLKEGGTAVLIDFGLAKQYDDAGEQTSSVLAAASKGYAPMEQYKDGGVSTFSPTTDIYSLGATLYKMLTAKTPPHANDVNEDGLPEMPSKISTNIKIAITAAMQSRRKDRPQSIESLLALLDSSASSDDTSERYANLQLIISSLLNMHTPLNETTMVNTPTSTVESAKDYYDDKDDGYNDYEDNNIHKSEIKHDKESYSITYYLIYIFAILWVTVALITAVVWILDMFGWTPDWLTKFLHSRMF